MAGYSRTVRRSYEINPISTMTSDSTVANTGRLMQTSDKSMEAPASGPGRARGPANHFHGRAVGDLLQAGHHHLVAFGQARGDLDAPAAPLADAHRHPLGLALGHSIYVALFARGNQGGFGNGQHLVIGKLQVDP